MKPDLWLVYMATRAAANQKTVASNSKSIKDIWKISLWFDAEFIYVSYVKVSLQLIQSFWILILKLSQ